MANHQISSTVHDRYHGGVKAKEMRSQKHENHMHAGQREEAAKPGLRLKDGYDKGFQRINDDGRIRYPRDKVDGGDHRHDKIDSYSRSQNDGRREPVGRNAYGPDKGQFSYGKPGYHNHGVRELFHGPLPLKSISITKVTVTHSEIFSGSHLGSPEKTGEAHKNFLNAAMSFIKNPSEQAYKALNDSMIKLMDPKFAPAATGGAAKVQIRNVNGTTMAKFTMEVTPAPTKSLDEAREDLKKAMSSKRNGEEGIADIRAEAHANYIRALSEKFKKEGKISHTNNTPTTPVFKSSVVYVVKVTQVNLQSLHELKKPNFQHNLNGKLTMKDHRSFWNDHRHNHKSYVDLMKQDAKKSHTGRDFRGENSIDKRHDSRRTDERRAERTGHDHRRTDERHDSRRSDERKTERTDHSRSHKARAHKA